MGGAGSISPPGGAPKPDPERVATLRYTLVDEPETCAAFGESARTALASLNDRALAETRSGDLGECVLLLDHVHDRVVGLDPARLEPRRGLAGLFDSRNKRLKAFRAAWASAASAVTQSAADLGDRASATTRRDTVLEGLWSETRGAITELDAHIAAGRSWLANEPREPVGEPIEPGTESAASVEQAHEPIDQADVGAAGILDESPIEQRLEAADRAASEAEPHQPAPVVLEAAESSETTVPTEAAEPIDVAETVAGLVPEPEPEAAPEPEPEPVHEPAPVASLPHPLETRLAALEAVRATAIGRLPLLRAAQNADWRAPMALKKVCDGIEAWRAEWHDALGLAGKRPKKVRSDRIRLTKASSALTGSITAAGDELSAAQGRRAELDARPAPAPIAALAA